MPNDGLPEFSEPTLEFRLQHISLTLISLLAAVWGMSTGMLDDNLTENLRMAT